MHIHEVIGTVWHKPTIVDFNSLSISDRSDPLARVPFDSNTTDFRTLTYTHALNPLINVNMYI